MRPCTSTNISAADASIDEMGEVIPADFVVALSAQAVVTGTSTGTLNIQASNDIVTPIGPTDQPTPTNWSNILTVGTVTISGAGIYLIPKFDICYRWLRASYVHNNGASGTINVIIQTYGF